MDLVTETVALIEVSEKDVNEKLKGMPCIVTSYKVKITTIVIIYILLVYSYSLYWYLHIKVMRLLCFYGKSRR